MENTLQNSNEKGKKKFKFKVPDALALIFMLLVIASIATYILPTGEFTRYENPTTGVVMVDPTSYHRVDNNPVSIWGVLKAIPVGLNESAEIINFLLIIGGVFGILEGTGALNSMLGSLIKKLSGKERMVIPFILTFWALGGSIIGNFEECLAFLPLQITLCLALGFDSILGVALGMCGVGLGYIGAILNPFTVGLAQKIAEVPMFSGIGLRVVAFVILLAVTITYLYVYAGKIQKNPELSPSYETDKNSPYKDNNLLNADVDFTIRQKVTLLVFLAGIVTLVYGVINFDFYLPEIAAVFVGIGVLCAIIGGLNMNETVDSFVSGATNLIYAALCVGFARAITVVMSQGNILDVIVYAVSRFVIVLPKQLTAIGMFIFQAIIKFFIPSGTGQAVVSMPIMTPLADVTGLTRQTAVLAYQMGDGFTNLITPTAGDLMAAIAIGGFSYGKWIKWLSKLLVMWAIVCCVILIIATTIGYGPI